MRLKIPRKVILHTFFSILTVVFTVVYPIIGYIQFKSIRSNDFSIGSLEGKVDLIFASLIVIGCILSIIRYKILQSSRFSPKRGSLNLLSAILILVFLGFTAQLGTFQITSGEFKFSLNLTGLFLLLMGIWALFIFKYSYDLIDFSIHRSYYDKLNLKRKKSN